MSGTPPLLHRRLARARAGLADLAHGSLSCVDGRSAHTSQGLLANGCVGAACAVAAWAEAAAGARLALSRAVAARGCAGAAAGAGEAGPAAPRCCAAG